MINNIKDLEKLFKLCRRQGVTELDLGSVKFKLGDMPEKLQSNQEDEISSSGDKWDNFPDRILTPEELMFYSSNPNGILPDDQGE